MNCIPGDIARVVISDNGNRDRLVRVLRAWPFGFNEWMCEALQPMNGKTMGYGTPVAAGGRGVCPDVCLRPIRDQPGEDETLTWADVPAKPELVPRRQVEHSR